MTPKTNKKLGWLGVLSTIGVAITKVTPVIAPFLPAPVSIGILMGTNIIGALTNSLHKPEEAQPIDAKLVEVAK